MANARTIFVEAEHDNVLSEKTTKAGGQTNDEIVFFRLGNMRQFQALLVLKQALENLKLAFLLAFL